MFQRLGPPGALPVKPGGSISSSSLSVSAGRSFAGIADVKPTWCKQSLVIVEAEQQRADDGFLLGIAKAADDAVGRPLLLDLDHRPLAGAIFEVAAAWR